LSEAMSICVLVSGGLDSCVLVHRMMQDYSSVQPIYVRCGLVWEDAELFHLREFLASIGDSRLRPVKILDVPMADVYGVHWSMSGLNVPDDRSPDEAVYLPGRNLLLLSKAAVFCCMNDISAIALGVLHGNPFPDSSLQFCRLVEQAVAEGLGCDVTVLRPFSGMTKRQVLELGSQLPLELTFSCMNPRNHLRRAPSLHCGTCNKCGERRLAFVDAGLPDNTEYAMESSCDVETPGLLQN